MSTAFPKSLSVSLHFLRGISAQLVVIGHGMNFAGVGFALRPPNFPYIQYIGVVVFFFMSGMVICHSIQQNLETGKYGFPSFFFDRAIRFAITVIPCLAIIYCLDRQSFGSEAFNNRYGSAINLPHLLGNALMLQRHPFFSIDTFGSARPLWSVSLEWWTYMFFGFVVLFRRTKPKMNLVMLPLFILSLPVVLPSLLGNRGLVLVWMLGAASAYVITRLPRLTGRLDWAVALGVFIVLAPVLYLQMFSMGDSFSLRANVAISILLFCGLYLMSHAEFGDGSFFAKSGKFLADYSFTLYCVHYSIFVLLAGAASWRGYSLLAAGFLISNLVCVAVAWFTEMRYKQYRAWIKAKLVRPESVSQMQETPL